LPKTAFIFDLQPIFQRESGHCHGLFERSATFILGLSEVSCFSVKPDEIFQERYYDRINPHSVDTNEKANDPRMSSPHAWAFPRFSRRQAALKQDLVFAFVGR
jgi:hypothetical protein